MPFWSIIVVKAKARRSASSIVDAIQVPTKSGSNDGCRFLKGDLLTSTKYRTCPFA